MRRDFYSYAKLELLEDARVRVACNEFLGLEERRELINQINAEYIQSINEADGPEFKTAKDMIGDISSSFTQAEATDIIIGKLFSESYAFQDEVYDFVESEEFMDYFGKAHIAVGGESVSFDDILDDVKEKAHAISQIAIRDGYSME